MTNHSVKKESPSKSLQWMLFACLVMVLCLFIINGLLSSIHDSSKDSEAASKSIFTKSAGKNPYDEVSTYYKYAIKIGDTKLVKTIKTSMNDSILTNKEYRSIQEDYILLKDKQAKILLLNQTEIPKPISEGGNCPKNPHFKCL